MAHFAKINDDNLVINVLTVNDEDVKNDQNVETESVGQAYLETHNNWPANKWIQTSYNTYHNTHKTEGKTAFRGNYAAIGYTWDPINNIFWEEKPHNSWVKDISTASWVAPIPYPSITDDGADPIVWKWDIQWNETAYQADNNKGWEATKWNVNNTDHDDTSTYEWNGSSWVVKS